MRILSRKDVVNYSRYWPDIFSLEKKKLEKALADNQVAIHHVGSTAVPDLAAKSQIDIIIVTYNQKLAAKQIEQLGYESKGELNIPFREYARKDNFNIHILPENHPDIEMLLLFRDYLRDHEEARIAYEKLKKQLSDNPENHYKNAQGFTEYTLGKNKFVRDILEKAGFKRYSLKFCLHHTEWDAYRKLSGDSQEIDTLANYFVYYKGNEIIAAAKVKGRNLEIIQGKELSEMQHLIEKWLVYKAQN